MEDYNRSIIEQINQQLKSGFAASLRNTQYCVVKAGVHGVLSVQPLYSVGDVQPEFGPATFAACIQHVNTYLVADLKNLTGHRHHLLRTDNEETDEENEP